MNPGTLSEKLCHAMKRLPSSFILVIIVPAAICLYLYAAHLPVAGFFHDDGMYIVTARSIYQGTGYSIVSLPGSPPQTKYPPVFPLLLSLCWHINPSFPENIVLMRLFSALCAVLVLFMAFFYLRLKSSYTALLSFLFLSALAFNPYFALLSGQIMSEMPFTLFSLASIVLFLRYERHGDKTSLYGSLLLAAIAFYTRSIGIALFLSFLLWFVCQRRFKASLGIFALMLVVTIPWFYWGYKNAPPGANSFVTTSYFLWFLSAVRSCSSSSISVFLPDSLGLSLPGLLCPSVRVHSITLSTILSIIFAVFFLLFFLKGILYWLRKSLSVDTLYLLITMVIIVVWSSSGFEPARFLIPLLPVVLFHLMEGVKAVREDIITLSFPCKMLTRHLWRLGVAVLLVGIYVVTTPQTTRLVRGTFQNSPALFHCIEEASAWISNNTERKDVIAPSMIHWYTCFQKGIQ